MLLSFGFGIPGIVWFLLEYGTVCKNDTALGAAEKSLYWLLTNKMLKSRVLNWPKYKKEVKGMILVLLKAYEILDKDLYRTIAEEALFKYPSHIVKSDFTQKSGLAGMGELYLEAWRVLQKGEWINRAEWIANVFLNTFFKTDAGSGYWVIEENNLPTADFMTGVGGIIHFLTRYLSASKLGYPLLK
jgi:hypothetical protein